MGDVAQTPEKNLGRQQLEAFPKTPNAAVPHVGPNPIFIHSSFRTSSTWLWLSFRKSASTVAFYEAFHEILASIRLEDIDAHHSSAWNSYHPNADTYFKEYTNLIRPTGGVQQYLDEMAFSRFVPTEGLSSPISTNEQLYLKNLIQSTIAANQTPVLTFCRSLGRASSIKRSFGGWHIFLYRNLFRQWMSYLQQLYQENDYFIHSTFLAIKFSQHDPYISWLVEECSISFDRAEDMTIGGFRNLDTAFYAFVGLHLYLSAHAFTELDQAIDVDRLSRDPKYRAETEELIATRAGIELDLSDAQSSFRFADGQWHPPQEAEAKIDRLCRRALKQLRLRPRSDAYDFGTRLARELMDQLGLYQHVLNYAHAKSSEISNLRDKRQKLECELKSLRSKLSDTRTELDQANEIARHAAQKNQRLEFEIQRLRSRMEDSHIELNHLKEKNLETLRRNQQVQCEAEALIYELGTARNELSKLDLSLRSMKKSISWRITKPLRATLAWLNSVSR